MPKLSRYPGFIFNKKSGSFYYRERFKEPLNGRKTRDHDLGKDKEKALALYQEYVKTLPDISTMEELIERFFLLEKENYSPATLINYRKYAKHINAAMGHISPGDISYELVLDYVDDRQFSPAVRTGGCINNEVKFLKTLMKFARRKRVISVLPFDSFDYLKQESREVEVSDADLATLRAHSVPVMQNYLDLKYLTGLRVSDMLALSSDNLKDGFLLVATQKSGFKKKQKFAVKGVLKVVIDRIIEQQAYTSTGARKLHFHFFTSIKKKPFKYQGFSTKFRNLVADLYANGKLSVKFTEHDLRAKNISDDESVFDANERAQHSSLSTTKKHYRRGYIQVKALDKLYY